MNSDRNHVPPTLNDDSTEESSYSLSGKIMVSVILILFFVVVLLIAFHLYVRSHLLVARRRQLSRRRSGLSLAHGRRRPSQIVFTTTHTVSDAGNRGLESSVLTSLPVFVYSAKTHQEPMDCAVCLSEFDENEKGRFLPKCNHSFHIECIDMWFHSHSTCPLCRAPVEPVPEPDDIGSSERTENEPTGARSGLCVACQHEEGNSSTSSLRSRRKGLDVSHVTIDVPLRNELVDELTLSSVGGGSRSPGTRLLSARMKRLLSIGGRKTPTSGRSTTPSGVESSNRMGDVDLEKGHSELTPR